MKKIITVICCLVGCGFATAQTTYSLEQLKQLAVENNYSLRSARNAIEQSKEVKSEAWTKYFPQVSALGFGFQNNKPMIDLDVELPDVIASLIPQDLIPANISLMKKGVYGSVSAIQPVFMGGQIINGNKLAKVGVEASELQLEASEDQVELITEQYYWQIVSNRNDLLQVQLRKGEIETAQVELENGLTTVSQLLAQHVGKTGEAIDISMPNGFAVGTVPELPIALRQDHQTALAATPQYRLLEKNVESHRLQHKMKVGQNMPNVGVGASYSYNDFFEKSSSAMVFAAVQVPISGWWGGSHAIKRQKLALQDAQEQMEDNGQKLIIRMNNAWAAVETSHKKLLIAHDAIEQAEENLRLNKDYYRVGSTKMSDLLLAQQQYQQARDRYTDAFADFQTKQLEYRQATGQE